MALQGLSPLAVQTQTTLSLDCISNHYGYFFLWPWDVVLMCELISTQSKPQVDPPTGLWSPFSLAPTVVVLCPSNSSHPQTLTSGSSIQ